MTSPVQPERSPIDLTGRTALITGASRGIGAAVAKAYAAAGAHVILIARTVGGLEKTDDDIRASGGTATLMPLDLTKLDALENLGPTLAQRFPRLDIAVLNAGSLGVLGPLTHTDPRQWAKVMDVNLNSNFHLLRSLEPLLRQSDAGRVIAVSSGVTRSIRAYWGAYAVSKAALEAMILTFAAETEKTSLRVNIIDPGRVRTRMRAEAYPGEDPETRPAPEQVTRRFLELASPLNTLHGQIIEAITE